MRGSTTSPIVILFVVSTPSNDERKQQKIVVSVPRSVFCIPSISLKTLFAEQSTISQSSLTFIQSTPFTVLIVYKTTSFRFLIRIFTGSVISTLLPFISTFSFYYISINRIVKKTVITTPGNNTVDGWEVIYLGNLYKVRIRFCSFLNFSSQYGIVLIFSNGYSWSLIFLDPYFSIYSSFYCRFVHNYIFYRHFLRFDNYSSSSEVHLIRRVTIQVSYIYIYMFSNNFSLKDIQSSIFYRIFCRLDISSCLLGIFFNVSFQVIVFIYSNCPIFNCICQVDWNYRFRCWSYRYKIYFYCSFKVCIFSV